MAPADLRALQGSGGTHADVRMTAQAPVVHAPAAHAPVAAPTAFPPAGPPSVAPPAAFAPAAPPSSLAPAAYARNDGGAGGSVPAVAPVHTPGPPAFVERGITAADIAAAGPLPPPPAPTPLGPPVAGSPQQPQWAGGADRLAQTRIVPRALPHAPAAKESTGSFDLGRSSLGRGSKRTVWMGVGAGVVALAVLGVWAASGSQEAATPAPSTPAALGATVERQPPAIPPPPPDTTPPAAAAAPKAVSVTPPPAAAAPVQTSVAAVPPPVMRQVAPAAPPPPRPVFVAPPPRPAARPKSGGGGTIVHDVPF
jgi:hypothetical protein